MSKILLVADMEGIGGIRNWKQCLPPNDAWEEIGRPLYTKEVQIAARALLESFDEVFIVDGHNASNNLIVSEFDGMPVKIFNHLNLYASTMLPEKALEVDAIALIGHHGMTSTNNVFSHAISPTNEYIYIDNVLIGETGLNMLGAASYGIPIIAVAGDEPACDEAKRLTENKILTFSTKHYEDKRAITYPVNDVLKNIEEIFRNAGKDFLVNGGFLYPIQNPCKIKGKQPCLL